MTPNELLEEAKGRFVPLYYNDESDLQALLKQALAKYQTKAGSIATVIVTEDDENVVGLPSDYLDLMMAVDSKARYVECAIDTTSSEITIIPADSDDDWSDTTFPVTVHYFQNMRDLNLASGKLPNGSTSMLLDYLVALIEQQNTPRKAMMEADIAGLQGELPSSQELKDRILQLEEQMEDMKAMVMPVAIF